MPRYPSLSPTVTGIRGSVYSTLARRAAAHHGTLYPLHVGDTWMEPAEGCRMQDLTVEEHPGMHRYAPVQGLPQLLEAVAARVAQRSGVATTTDHVLIAAGATGALGATIGAMLSPGDEVLLMAPYWPLIAGIVRSFHGTPVDVPLIGAADSPETAVDAFEALRTPATVAVYLNTPHNPTGRVLPPSWIAALVAWAARHDLWVLSDEVYEDYVYEGEHTPARGLDPERIFVAHSFSKAYGMAGNRCGYVVGPADRMADLRKVSVHTFYSTPTASQLAALAALEGPGQAWVERARAQYAEIGRWSAERLGVPP
ncbi:MAG TPA: pyridoxal phosphate-dependent aminotransferase, partial [Thermoanaerobaculia bacterium]|nr:pyridoxal phosphate-dependent aminotransferase [Thermoanaerobaculia bacterium]